MNQAAQSSATFRRRRLWIQILSFLAIVTLIWLKPSIEDWLDAHNLQNEPTVAKDSADDVDQPSAGARIQRVDPEDSDPLPKSRTSAIRNELGTLKEIRDNVFQSTGGLVYRTGSEDGHRLKHIMQHARDIPKKQIHGVFDGDGDRDFILAVIDEAFLKAKQGGTDVRWERQNERQVYTINLRRRIGQLGGQAGEDAGHPECRYIRIVLENENEVISAYPTRSF